MSMNQERCEHVVKQVKGSNSDEMMTLLLLFSTFLYLHASPQLVYNHYLGDVLKRSSIQHIQEQEVNTHHYLAVNLDSTLSWCTAQLLSVYTSARINVLHTMLKRLLNTQGRKPVVYTSLLFIQKKIIIGRHENFVFSPFQSKYYIYYFIGEMYT